MRKITALLSVALLIGCKDPKASVELKGQLDVPAPPRYQIIINTNYNNKEFQNPIAFLLDTQQGRIWYYKLYEPLHDSPAAWVPSWIVEPPDESLITTFGVSKEAWDNDRKLQEGSDRYKKEMARMEELSELFKLEERQIEEEEVERLRQKKKQWLKEKLKETQSEAESPVTITVTPAPTATPIYR